MSCEERLRVPGLSSLEETKSGPHSSLQLPEEGKQREVPSSAPSWELVAEGKWYRATPGEGWDGYWETFLYRERGQTLEQAS